MVSSAGQPGEAPKLLPHSGSDGGPSTVVLGYLLAGRSPAERVAFLAELHRAEPVAVGPRARIYRNYTRRRLRGGSCCDPPGRFRRPIRPAGLGSHTCSMTVGTPGWTRPSSPAATHGDGPLVILAGAGTGKTRTLTARVAASDRSGRGAGADPAADVHPPGRRRHAGPGGGDVHPARRRPRKLQGGTFHAVAHRLVAAHTEALGLPPALSGARPRATPRDLMDLLRHDHGLDRRPRPRYPARRRRWWTSTPARSTPASRPGT